jgi:DNA replication protein DnaC
MASDGYVTSRDLDNSGQKIDFRCRTGACSYSSGRLRSRGVSGALTRPTPRSIATIRRRMPLNRLKLTAIRDQLDSLVDEAARRELTIREALSLFCEREIGRKDERRIEMSIGLARFPFVRDLDGFDFTTQPSIDKKQIREIAAGRFIANAEAVLLLGPPGVGKTHVAVAIGRQAILAGYTVLFVPPPTLVAQLAKAHSEGRLGDRLTHFGKPKLLIVDELGYLPFEPNAAHLCFQLARGALSEAAADHQQSLDWRVRNGVRRRLGGDRHPRPPAPSQPRPHHPRRQLPAVSEVGAIYTASARIRTVFIAPASRRPAVPPTRRPQRRRPPARASAAAIIR